MQVVLRAESMVVVDPADSGHALHGGVIDGGPAVRSQTFYLCGLLTNTTMSQDPESRAALGFAVQGKNCSNPAKPNVHAGVVNSYDTVVLISCPLSGRGLGMNFVEGSMISGRNPIR